MKDDALMRRLRAARPAAGEPIDHAAHFARIVAEPGDPRLADAPRARSILPWGQTARSWARGRPRILAGGTLGLAGVGAALVLVLSAGGAAAPPAFAVTQSADGSVLVDLTAVSQVPAAERQLAALGVNEWFEPLIAPGAAPESGPISCRPAPASGTAAGRRLARATPAGSTPATGGPPVKLLLAGDGTGTVPSGDTGAGPWHLVACYLYAGAFPGAGNTGNTGAG